MVIVWDNPSPNRTGGRPRVWELVHQDGSTRIIATDEIQAAGDGEVENGVKETKAVIVASSIGFCF